MNTSFHDLLFQILTIISYPNDKEKFIHTFKEQNTAEALVNIILKFPKDIQQEFKKTDNLPNAIQKNISNQIFQEELLEVSISALLNYLDTIWKLITRAQQEKIKDLLKKMIPENL